ncbi:hypothetical protein D9M72_251300 [compost metagenome]
MGPVIGAIALPQFGGDPLRHLGRLEQVLQGDAHALHLAFRQALDDSGIGDIDQRQGAVQFGADLEHADHVEALHARGDAARCAAHLGHDQGQLVTDVEAEAPRGDLADDDAGLSRLQRIQVTPHHVLADDGNLGLFPGIDAVDLHRLHHALDGKHAFQFGEGYRPHHFRVLHRGIGHAAPVIQRLVGAQGGMGDHAEDARAHFLLEAVHHRKHYDHGQYAERQADHRGQRDERDVVVTALGAGIARADEDRERSEHLRQPPVGLLPGAAPGPSGGPAAGHGSPPGRRSAESGSAPA